MDGGHVCKDGKRLMGEGKTWSGFLGGVALATILGMILAGLVWLLGIDKSWGWGLKFPEMVFIFLPLAIGAMTGDALKSIAKRRMNMPRGSKFPIVDQYDFVVGAIGLVALFRWDWFHANYLEGVAIFALISVLMMTFLLHRGANIIAYRMGKKNEPW